MFGYLTVLHPEHIEPKCLVVLAIAPGPMTYRVGRNRKQYLVIAAGGHPKITEESLSDALVAFTLP